MAILHNLCRVAGAPMRNKKGMIVVEKKTQDKSQEIVHRLLSPKCSEMRRISESSAIDFSRTFVNGSGHVTLTSSLSIVFGL